MYKKSNAWFFNNSLPNFCYNLSFTLTNNNQKSDTNDKAADTLHRRCSSEQAYYEIINNNKFQLSPNKDITSSYFDCASFEQTNFGQLNQIVNKNSIQKNQILITNHAQSLGQSLGESLDKNIEQSEQQAILFRSKELANLKELELSDFTDEECLKIKNNKPLLYSKQTDLKDAYCKDVQYSDMNYQNSPKKINNFVCSILDDGNQQTNQFGRLNNEKANFQINHQFNYQAQQNNQFNESSPEQNNQMMNNGYFLDKTKNCSNASHNSQQTTFSNSINTGANKLHNSIYTSQNAHKPASTIASNQKINYLAQPSYQIGLNAYSNSIAFNQTNPTGNNLIVNQSNLMVNQANN